MAEAVFAARARLTPLAPRIKIDSCGTAAYHVGETPDERTVSTCRKVSFAFDAEWDVWADAWGSTGCRLIRVRGR